ncbi:PEP-CTERM protein-sorting domain-containing protein [Nitrosospira sp. Nl5]|uniref:PEP-CTERM sorting domain-containing protein n=1 Tax=Nitrosospira sp. Nl5 TaxID=200120 RepID=UPI00088D75FC|nr:PEP-CTERM sorting domain-containing protein [Nitrosospira sp. Nl5]SCY31846.1 PEP-CTERM protein-sorting domain-containing protein [Nitrosospira sp. Nl5]
MKKELVLISALFFNAGAAMANGTVSWALWSGPNATFTQNSDTIDLTYTGQWNSIDTNASYFNTVPASFTSPEVTNTPGANGAIHMVGGTSEVNTLHFSQPVVDPVIAVYSVGRTSAPVTFNFLDDPTFVIASQGAGYWGGGTLTQSGNSVTGLEGNGLLQFTGSYTDISFTTPDSESFYGFTVGAMATVVPEPETYAMLLAGLGLMGFLTRRRKAS